MQKRLEVILGRPLTPEESSHVKWLEGWDYDTRIAAESIYIAFFRAGQMDIYNVVKERVDNA
ncbi:hypothetical protein [Paenibacillus sinopodophylli]|uniref:hypothetical protein n=1 Tax=Paenibacillus sinopodophylli TaxID=1837342 RepID=UPI00110D243A|nr:hypothetical protein [Paenibacillus sinopodophylli]